ncbi:hypothetical protein niasHT_038528 [Heterodera trifolii]|uniref:Uncharacterized protein n=1 Tax=Heterodera trifolii TaxID=157864 RepID=A0ABD2I781_9BILA
MRFIGLILWHFVFRQNPIWDTVNANLVFFAKLSPNIDPADVLKIDEMLKEMEKQLEERVDGHNNHFDKLLDEKQFFEEYLHDQQLHDQLKQQQNGAAQSIMEEEKRSELAQKLQLLRSQYIFLVQQDDADQTQQQCAVISSQIQYYNLIDRSFIVFGKDATALILLARALLEDKMDGKQLENYLNNDQNLFNNINIDDDDYSYIKMASKLGKISKDY